MAATSNSPETNLPGTMNGSSHESFRGTWDAVSLLAKRQKLGAALLGFGHHSSHLRNPVDTGLVLGYTLKAWGRVSCISWEV